MMGLVAIAGVSAAVFRVHPALGCLAFSVLGLAALRTSTVIESLRADGASIRPWNAARIFLTSMLVASTILVATLFTVILFSSWAFYNVDHPTVLGSILILIPSAFLATPIVVLLKRWMW
ncbi:MAG: hypothetical protein P4L85_03960 [Paludisphaera borealis]|uniref:hypothetical protein n=1 Tax=Paludisphaera borealis TaxID=1387353 RepID=UPI002844F667|nr:hypothetical protein [Paludisphaera borealis]MDR3618482.1 hypothetical protein [Paludisphaera borealis]